LQNLGLKYALSRNRGNIMNDTLYESKLSGLERLSQGKVRDIYAVDNRHLLIVTTDRLSAFDVVLPDPIPGKGAVLTKLSNFWFARTHNIVPNHLTDLKLTDVISNAAERAAVNDRAIVVKRLQPLPVAAKLAEPVFTPATKAEAGDHDENISFAQMCGMVGKELAERVRDLSIAIYLHGAAYARERGIIIADTKFEFGLDSDGKLYLIDEVMTPDSSRFWPADQYAEGISPPSFDKQFVRDYLETLDWNKQAPGPKLPASVIAKTAEKYRQALDQLTA
jgi:phosphoribosylaminoimidazole-succinocarboxamide synthase